MMRREAAGCAEVAVFTGAMFYDEGIQKLVSRYDKCLNNGGNYVEK
jgi:hypothetical protein